MYIVGRMFLALFRLQVEVDHKLSVKTWYYSTMEFEGQGRKAVDEQALLPCFNAVRLE